MKNSPEIWPIAITLFVLFLCLIHTRLVKLADQSPSSQLGKARRELEEMRKHIKRQEQREIVLEMEIDHLRSKVRRLEGNFIKTTRRPALPTV